MSGSRDDGRNGGTRHYAFLDKDVMSTSSLESSITTVKNRIRLTCERCGRDPDNITLIGVTKTFPPETVVAAFELGLMDFGENYAQELAAKAKAVGNLPIRWHFIGALQTNKVKLIGPIVSTIHSVDRPSLIEELAKRIGPQRSLDVFIEVNLASEVQKSGARPADVEDLCRRVLMVPTLKLRGLMAVPPLSDDPEASRPYFKALRGLLERTRNALHVPPGVLEDLSMGMSHDLEVAIEEGATFVRVGTAIFGPRPERNRP